MIDSNRHIDVLQQTLNILSRNLAIRESTVAAVIGLYGFRVWVASENYLGRSVSNGTLVEGWTRLKRNTAALGEVLNAEFDSITSVFGVRALLYHPDYKKFKDDDLTQTILLLDRLEAKVSTTQDVESIGRVLQSFLTRRMRNYVSATMPFTSPAVLNTLAAQLLTEDLKNKPYSVYDPVCGVGGSLIALYLQLTAMGIPQDKLTLYGQDVREEAVFIAAWNLLLSGATNIQLEVADTLKEPRFLKGRDLERFNLVLAHPPVHYVAEDDFGAGDPHHRFRYGAVQSSRADYAFVQHVIASLLPEGRAIIILPLSALSRSGFEEDIRANLVHAGILSASISFQAGMLLEKDTPAAMLLVDLGKRSDEMSDIFFINAPVNRSYSSSQPATLEARALQTIVETLRQRINEEGFSRGVSLEGVRARWYSLAPPTYVPARTIMGPVRTDGLDWEIEVAEKKLREEQSRFRDALFALQDKRPHPIARKKKSL